MNQETRVGLFLLAAIVAIASAAVFLGNIKLFERSHRYYADFNDVEALPPKAAVKISGVEIGKVTKVTLENGRAHVAIDIAPDIPLYADAVASIGSTGIIGSKFFELKPGTAGQSQLEPGATLRTVEGKSLNEIINKMSTLFEEDDKYGNAMTNIKATIANLRNVSEALNQAMGEHAMEMEEIVMNVRDLTGSVKTFAAHLEEISTEKKEDIKVAIEKIRGVAEKLDVMMTRINSGKGMLGTLVADDKAGQEVKEAVTSIKDTAASAKKVLGRFTSIHTYWNIRYRYDTTEEEGKTDVGLTFVPKPGKFYGFGVTNVGKPEHDEKHVVYERKNRITAVLGHDYGPFTGYAGAIRSRGGAGLMFRPLFFNPAWAQRFNINTEVFDFGRDEVVRGQHLTKANLSAGAQIALKKWLWLGARWEDVLEHSRFLAYTNIVFRDEDLAYFFGFASLSR